MTGNRASADDLDAALRQLAQSIDIAPHPDYATQVQQVLADPSSAPRANRRRPRLVAVQGTRRLLLAAAILLLATSVVTVAVPATRHALASWLGFSGVDIRRVPSALSAAPAPHLPSMPADLRSGPEVSLDQARTASANRLVLPAGLPPPERVYLLRQGTAVIVTLAYRAVPGLDPTVDTGYALIVTEIFDAGEPLIEKLLHTGATATQVDVNGHVGVYLEGPQEIINLARTASTNDDGDFYEVEPRASANTLIWSNGPSTYRIEADFQRDAAAALAASLH